MLKLIPFARLCSRELSYTVGFDESWFHFYWKNKCIGSLCGKFDDATLSFLGGFNPTAFDTDLLVET